MSWLVKIPETLFVLAISLFILSASVAWAVNDEGLYQQGFDDYHISTRTGISQVDLRAVGADIRRYFNSSEESLRVRARVYGVERELFTAQEVTHMRDVKVLVQKVYLVMQVAGAFLVAGIIGGIIGGSVGGRAIEHDLVDVGTVQVEVFQGRLLGGWRHCP